MDQLLIGVLASMAAGIVVIFFAAMCFSIWKLYALLSRIQKNLENLQESNKTIEATLDGISRLCSDLISSASKMSTSVDKFQKNIFDQNASVPRRDAFQPYSESNADNAWKVMELSRSEGISEEEAKERLSTGMDMGRFVVHE